MFHEVSEVIPSRIQERIGNVRFAARVTATIRTLHLIEFFVRRERRLPLPLRTEILYVRQLDRQVFLGRGIPASCALRSLSEGWGIALPAFRAGRASCRERV